MDAPTTIVLTIGDQELEQDWWEHAVGSDQTHTRQSVPCRQEKAAARCS